MTADDLAARLDELVAEYGRVAALVAEAGPKSTLVRAARIRRMGVIVKDGNNAARVLGVDAPDWAEIRLLAGLDS